jgi:hypothetical protein
MKHVNNKTNQSTFLDIYADLTVNFDAGTVVFSGDGNRIFAHTPSLRVAFALLKTFKRIDTFEKFLRAADLQLKRMDVTIFWQNRRFGILGSEGKRYLLAMLIWLCKPSKR